MSIKEKARLLSYKLKSRVVVTTLGFLALALLIWFGGPLIAIAGAVPLASAAWRLVLILSIVVVWLLATWSKRVKQNKRNEQMANELIEGDADANSDVNEEIDTLKKRMSDAIDTLKTAKLYKNQNVYQLPWYIMIGPPGSGKTTAINNSGLDYPLRESMGIDMIQGVGGTRNCDWWFTNKAVLIDTAGRYTTQDSHARHDARAWQGFLGLLRKNRPLRPINGVVISMGISELMHQTKTERNLHARAIKQRLQELQNQLGMSFPVYVILSKADLIAGFNEYFEYLTEEEAEQVLGVTFELNTADNEQAPVNHFNREFHALISNLAAKLNQRLMHERDPKRRGIIFEFPRQLRVLQGIADTFLKEIFTPNAYEQLPILRGVYLTSATQEGVPEDLLAHKKGYSANTGGESSRAFFIKRLLEEVVFPEQNLASTNRHHDKQNKWMRIGAISTAACATLALSISWYLSYSWNKELIGSTQSAINEYQRLTAGGLNGQTDLHTLTKALNRLRDLPAGYSDHIPLADPSAVGYDKGSDLKQPSVEAYKRALFAHLAPYMGKALTKEMSEHKEHLGYLYETLRAYLMLYMPERFKAEDIQAWFAAYIEREMPGDAHIADRQDLNSHIATLLAEGFEGVDQDLAAVKNARVELTKLPLVDRAYQRLKTDFIDSSVADFKLSDVISYNSMYAFSFKSGRDINTGIPGLYTHSGFHGIFNIEKKKLLSNLLHDSWVYGDNLSEVGDDAKARIEKDLEYRYFRDYIYYWEEFLDDLTLRPYSTTEEGVRVTEILSGPEAPIKNILAAVQKNVALTKMPVSKNQKAAAAVAANAADVALHSKTSRLKRLLPNEMPDIEMQLPGAEVEQAFAKILEVDPDSLEDIQTNLRSLNRYLDKLANGDQQKLSFKTKVASNTDPKFIATLRSQSRSLPYPFDNWLEGMTHNADRITKASANQHLNEIWRSQVVREYRVAIADRYPFNPISSQEVRMRDFSRFFGPDGTLDKFFKRYLAANVDTSTSPWRFERDIGVSQRSLAMFEQASKIRQAFFSSGSDKPSLQFGLKPISLDKKVSNFRLEIDGQALNYRHGPLRVVNMTWPGDSAESETRIVFTPPEGGRSTNTTYSGEWSLFRMLDDMSQKRPETKDDHQLHIALSGNEAKVQLLPSSTIHPFWSANIESFRCPTKL
ncbi:type VI secretion system membrane subunit TssM [Pseudoalteromonas sp. CO325X]|uniref:type VI secretion system membrane subunit TssM n=1 Tax=Pseudoalteromonas sp. CO325X TaxID=1777262 RepID=UPI001023DBC9|nr:type VI secretion system membrane subunit TssM [Pseudoalteromonas sp. CO325X]RZF83607.1 type VI secretion system membrane subunit TssM [Pseudoalteromonas sp. CO325X]